MLGCDQLGDILHYRMGRSVAGRSLLTTGVFLVDGLLVDTGPSHCAREVESILDRHVIDQVVLTHHHEDHAGNAALVARRLDVDPLAHEAAGPLLRHPEPLPLYRRLVWGPTAPCATQDLGGELETPHHVFRVLDTPGHAPDHVVLHEPDRRWLFSGDLFITRRPTVMSDDTDVTTLIDSLRRLLKLPDCRMFCQHSGRHDSHQKALGDKLDWLLGLQEKAVMHHEEGRTLRETTRALGLRKSLWRFISRGEFSGENLVRELLRDAGITEEAPGERAPGDRTTDDGGGEGSSTGTRSPEAASAGAARPRGSESAS